jgi:hypothetical protein
MKRLCREILMGLVIAGVLAWATGCANAQWAKVQQQMDANIGVLTYDQAITQMGPPTATSEGDAVIVADWVMHTKTTMAMPIAGFWYTQEQPHGQRWRLIFDRQTKRLTEWKYDRW